MVICRGTACIFIWVLLVDKYICFLFFAMSKSICKNSWLSSNITFCAFLINSLFVIFQKSVYCIMAVALTKNEKYGIMNVGSEAMYRKARAGYIDAYAEETVT